MYYEILDVHGCLWTGPYSRCDGDTRQFRLAADGRPHTLIDVPLDTIYLDCPYYNGHCKVMYVSSPVYPVIIGNMRGACQMLPDRCQTVALAMTMTTKVVIYLVGCSKRIPTEGKLRRETQRANQLKKNDNLATQDVKVQEGTTEEKFVVGPVLTRSQMKENDKIYPLKVKEAMSSSDKSTIEDLQKKDSTLKKCFVRVGKLIIRENYLGEFFMKI